MEGSQSFVQGNGVVAVQIRSGSAAECNVTASLTVTWVALVVIVHVLRANG